MVYLWAIVLVVCMRWILNELFFFENIFYCFSTESNVDHGKCIRSQRSAAIKRSFIRHIRYVDFMEFNRRGRRRHTCGKPCPFSEVKYISKVKKIKLKIESCVSPSYFIQILKYLHVHTSHHHLFDVLSVLSKIARIYIKWDSWKCTLVSDEM